jgi:hypothetical protein
MLFCDSPAVCRRVAAAALGAGFRADDAGGDAELGRGYPGSWRLMPDITRIISPSNVWPGLPRQEQ